MWISRARKEGVTECELNKFLNVNIGHFAKVDKGPGG